LGQEKGLVDIWSKDAGPFAFLISPKMSKEKVSKSDEARNFDECVQFIIDSAKEYLAGEYDEEVFLTILGVQMERLLVSSEKVENAVLAKLNEHEKTESDNAKSG
jgi:hypothetical protein